MTASTCAAFGSAFVKAVMDGMDVKRAVLAGNWLGGYWAMCFAADYPERVRAADPCGRPRGRHGDPGDVGDGHRGAGRRDAAGRARGLCAADGELPSACRRTCCR